MTILKTNSGKNLSIKSPSLRLSPGALINSEIEIVKLLSSDREKNVYAGQLDFEIVVLLEFEINGERDDTVDFKIPESCKNLFPEIKNKIRTDGREYIVFAGMEGSTLDESQLKCWEPDLLSLFHNIIKAILKLSEKNLKTGGISLKDIVYLNDQPLFYILPQKAVDQGAPDSIIRALIKELCYEKISPRITRNLENPLRSLGLSLTVENLITDFISEKTTAENVCAKLASLNDVPIPDWDVQSVVDVGQTRDHNEDACGWMSSVVNSSVFSNAFISAAVADGMGGHQKGEFASHLALKAWLDRTYHELSELTEAELENPEIKRTLSKIFQIVAETVLNNETFLEIPARTRPGTTLVGILLLDRVAFIGNCGDSRTYVIREKGIERITVDHSLVQTYIDSGQITAEEAFQHEDSNVITSFIGIEPKLFKHDIYVYHLEPKETLLLCSDGLCDMLKDNEILDIVNQAQTSQETATRLISAANANGGKDNISVVVIKDRIKNRS